MISRTLRRGWLWLPAALLTALLTACLDDGYYSTGLGYGADSYGVGYYEPFGYYGRGWDNRYWVGPPGRAGRPPGDRRPLQGRPEAGPGGARPGGPAGGAHGGARPEGAAGARPTPSIPDRPRAAAPRR